MSSHRLPKLDMTPSGSGSAQRPTAAQVAVHADDPSPFASARGTPIQRPQGKTTSSSSHHRSAGTATPGVVRLLDRNTLVPGSAGRRGTSTPSGWIGKDASLPAFLRQSGGGTSSARKPGTSQAREAGWRGSQRAGGLGGQNGTQLRMTQFVAGKGMGPGAGATPLSQRNSSAGTARGRKRSVDLAVGSASGDQVGPVLVIPGSSSKRSRLSARHHASMQPAAATAINVDLDSDPDEAVVDDSSDMLVAPPSRITPSSRARASPSLSRSPSPPGAGPSTPSPRSRPPPELDPNLTPLRLTPPESYVLAAHARLCGLPDTQAREAGRRAREAVQWDRGGLGLRGEEQERKQGPGAWGGADPLGDWPEDSHDPAIEAQVAKFRSKRTGSKRTDLGARKSMERPLAPPLISPDDKTPGGAGDAPETHDNMSFDFERDVLPRIVRKPVQLTQPTQPAQRAEDPDDQTIENPAPGATPDEVTSAQSDPLRPGISETPTQHETAEVLLSLSDPGTPERERAVPRCPLRPVQGGNTPQRSPLLARLLLKTPTKPKSPSKASPGPSPLRKSISPFVALSPTRTRLGGASQRARLSATVTATASTRYESAEPETAAQTLAMWDPIGRHDAWDDDEVSLAAECEVAASMSPIKAPARSRIQSQQTQDPFLTAEDGDARDPREDRAATPDHEDAVMCAETTQQDKMELGETYAAAGVPIDLLASLEPGGSVEETQYPGQAANAEEPPRPTTDAIKEAEPHAQADEIVQSSQTQPESYLPGFRVAPTTATAGFAPIQSAWACVDFDEPADDTTPKAKAGQSHAVAGAQASKRKSKDAQPSEQTSLQQFGFFAADEGAPKRKRRRTGDKVAFDFGEVPGSEGEDEDLHFDEEFEVGSDDQVASEPVQVGGRKLTNLMLKPAPLDPRLRPAGILAMEREERKEKDRLAGATEGSRGQKRPEVAAKQLASKASEPPAKEDSSRNAQRSGQAGSCKQPVTPPRPKPTRPGLEVVPSSQVSESGSNLLVPSSLFNETDLVLSSPSTGDAATNSSESGYTESQKAWWSAFLKETE